MFFLIGSALTARGIVTEQYTHIAFCALALVPLLLGVYRVSKARHHAKLEMVRRAFENERSARQEGVTLEDDERTAVVAHHIVLSYLEEVLETCVYGTSATHIDRMRAYERATANKNQNEAAAAADGQGQQEGEVNNANNAQKPPSAAPAQGLNVEKDINKPPAQILMSAAQGLRGNTKRGGLTEYMMNTPYPCCSQVCSYCAYLLLPTSSSCPIPALYTMSNSVNGVCALGITVLCFPMLSYFELGRAEVFLCSTNHFLRAFCCVSDSWPFLPLVPCQPLTLIAHPWRMRLTSGSIYRRGQRSTGGHSRS